ncbi:MAG: PAS domain S-box protein [Desulfobacteraceae bacterium]|nr:PAS domain S-box protein [Desulfobacteraceae bacterium]
MESTGESLSSQLEKIPVLCTQQKDIWSYLNNSPIGIYIIQENNFVFSNTSFREIIGLTEAELSEKHPLDLVFHEDRAFARENAVQMLKGERKDPYQFRILPKGGEIRWITETVASVSFQDRRAVLGNFMDTTRTRQIEEALSDSEYKYRSLFELARDGIVIVRYTDGTILDSNMEFQRQTQYGRKALLEKKIWETQPSEFQAEARKTFFRFRETHGGIVSWKLCQSREGSVLPVEIAARRMSVEGLDVILCMVRDISEREAMMRALTHASEEWRKSFDAIDDAVVLITPEFRIQRGNLAAARMLNTDIRSIIGRHCYQLFHGTDAPPEYCPHLKALEMGFPCKAENEELSLGRFLHYSSSPLKDEQGNVVQTVEIISDITALRKHEQESARLEQALAESFQGITGALSDLVESRDTYTAGHSRHVARMAVLVGKQIGLCEEDIQGLRICAILHDIGKAIVPASILNKPGRLSVHEWGLIHEHTTTAYETLRHIPFPWPVADVVFQHHERIDGSGYPKGLKGNQIHLWARIIAVADVVDAMTSHRPYRPRLPRFTALDELEKGCGTLYDPELANALIHSMHLEDRRILVIDTDYLSTEALVMELKADGLTAIGYQEPVPALRAFEQKPFPFGIDSA